MAPTREDVLSALKEVYDPEIPINIVDLGLVYRVDFPSEKKVEVDMTLTAIGCPVGPQMVDTVRQTCLMVPGVEEADVNLVWRPPWDPKKATEDGKIMLSAMGVRVD
jgi:metal-sulfur cluster biosynthetic enzyme